MTMLMIPTHRMNENLQDIVLWLHKNVGGERHISTDPRFNGEYPITVKLDKHDLKVWSTGNGWTCYIWGAVDSGSFPDAWEDVEIVEIEDPILAALFALKFG